MNKKTSVILSILAIVLTYTTIMVGTIIISNDEFKKLKDRLPESARTEEEKCIKFYSKYTINNIPAYCIKYFMPSSVEPLQDKYIK